MAGARQKSHSPGAPKWRQKIPECLEPEELRALLSQLDRRFRVMVLLDAASGLRRSEPLVALKWSDVDFDELQIDVRRSIYLNVIGNCKTEASRKPVPMDPMFASELWSWKQDSPYRQSDDWLFASPRTRGRNPYWPDSLLAHVIRPTALRRDRKAHRLAHVSAQLFQPAGGEWGKCEGRTGVDATRQLPVHA
jgi:integrase